MQTVLSIASVLVGHDVVADMPYSVFRYHTNKLFQMSQTRLDFCKVCFNSYNVFDRKNVNFTMFIVWFFLSSCSKLF